MVYWCSIYKRISFFLETKSLFISNNEINLFVFDVKIMRGGSCKANFYDNYNTMKLKKLLRPVDTISYCINCRVDV